MLPPLRVYCLRAVRRPYEQAATRAATSWPRRRAAHDQADRLRRRRAGHPAGRGDGGRRGARPVRIKVMRIAGSGATNAGPVRAALDGTASQHAAPHGSGRWHGRGRRGRRRRTRRWPTHAGPGVVAHSALGQADGYPRAVTDPVLQPNPGNASLRMVSARGVDMALPRQHRPARRRARLGGPAFTRSSGAGRPVPVSGLAGRRDARRRSG